MMPRAKVFNTGGSQAVRLPAEFRFDRAEVDIRRDPLTGDVILSKTRASLDDYLAWAETLDLPADFMLDREQPEDDFRDPFAKKPVTKKSTPRTKR
jgi:antitoxin VapB